MKSFSYLLLLLILGTFVSCDKDESTENSDKPVVLQDETKTESISSSSGGDIVMTSGVKVDVPANALSSDKQITIETIDPTQEENSTKLSEDIKGDMVSAVVRCGPEGTTFETPVEITIPYYPDMFPENTTVDDLIVISYSGDSVELVPFTVDASSQVVIAEAMHFSDFVVVSEQGILVYRGKMYNTVVINGKEWMAENLAYLPAINIPTDSSLTDPRYLVLYYTGTDLKEAKATDNFKKYGALYNYNAAILHIPNGWHIPTKEEWEDLLKYVDEQRGSTLYAVDVYGQTRYKDMNQYLLTTSGWLVNGTNDFGFSALPSGWCDANGTFAAHNKDHQKSAGWWCSTVGSPRGADLVWCTLIFEGISQIDGRHHSDINIMAGLKATLFSIRLVKD